MRILLIAKFFPPANSVASHRLYSFARYLPEFGIDVDVLTPEREGTLFYDLSGMTIFYPNRETISVTKYVKRKNRIRDILKYSGIRSFKHYLWSSFFRSAKKFVKKLDFKKYDAVMASYGPEDAVHIAYYIHRKTHLPFILDYRDLWYDNLYAKWTPIDKLIIHRLEKRIVDSTILLTAATDGVRKQIEKRYGIPGNVIYNGFFDDAFDTPAAGENNGSRISFCYTGSLYGGIQPIHILFPLLAHNPSYHLHIAVLDEIDYYYVNDLVKKYAVDDQVHCYPNLSNSQAVSLQQQANILLYLNRMDGSATCVLAVKLFEYMKTGKFILGIGHSEDEAKVLFRKYHLGAYVTSSEDLPAALEQVKTWKSPSRADIAFFNRKNQAEILAKEIKRRFPNLF
jgi:glycosyltransferase involved in cell wall biosynthesis